MTSVLNALNPTLANLPVYQPGRPIEEVAREYNLPVESVIKVASNENPLGPSPKAIAAMRNVLDALHLYPDGNAFYLKRKLAQKLNVACLLYTSDAADERSSVDLGGRRII